MRVGITTIHNHLNYGAVLQAYALSQSVRRLGHSCKVIDCQIDPGHGRKFPRSRHPGELMANLFQVWHWRDNRRFEERFRAFSEQYVPRTKEIYRTYADMVSVPPSCDAYITGSDQVWHPGLLGREIGDAYHLGFAAPDKSRLLAYAPSFGVSEIPSRYAEKIGQYLRRYHALSVREKRGQEIIRELSGRESELVLDPTLLLSAEDYAPLAEHPGISGKYLLAYPMEIGDNWAFYELVKEAQKLLALPTIIVVPLFFHHRWLLLSGKFVLNAGPKEFLGLIKHAEFVCTNSFHGTVFSILFQKQFLGVPHSTSNERIYCLLEKLGLLDRQLTSRDSKTLDGMLHKSIDYTKVADCLRKEVSHSTAFLSKALGS